jgi:WD40 repeat protein
MDDARWSRLTRAFPRLLQGARVGRDPLTPATQNQPPFLCGAFSPDETLIALSGGGRIPCRPAIWVARIPSLETVATLHGHQGVHDLAWHRETGLLASASNDYTVVMWDVDRGDHLFVTGANEEPIVKGRVAFARDALYIGETEAFVGLKAHLLRVSLEDGTICALRELDPGYAVKHLAVDPDTERWAMVVDDFHHGGGGARAKLVRGAGAGAGADGGEQKPAGADVLALGWKAGELVSATSEGDDADYKRAAFSRDGGAVAIAHHSRLVAREVADGANARERWSVDLPSGQQGLTTFLGWSPSGAYLWVAGFGTLSVLDGRTGATVVSAPPPAWFAGR